MKKLIIISIALILVNITSAYFLTRRENLYMNNWDDNSFFHANQKFGYAEGLSNEIYYHRNNKDLIKINPYLHSEPVNSIIDVR